MTIDKKKRITLGTLEELTITDHQTPQQIQFMCELYENTMGFLNSHTCLDITSLQYAQALMSLLSAVEFCTSYLKAHSPGFITENN
jgi:hypothetical protein